VEGSKPPEILTVWPNGVQCKKGEMGKEEKGKKDFLRENFAAILSPVIFLFPLSLFSFLH
jgi:hypothetical protein